MIGVIVAAVGLAFVGLHAVPEHKPKPKCPADTVWFHIKTHTDWAYGIPVETVDTTWVIRSDDAR